MVTINSLLVSTGSGLDQSATTRNRTQFSYVDDGCLNSSRGVIFSGSHRIREVLVITTTTTSNPYSSACSAIAAFGA